MKFSLNLFNLALLVSAVAIVGAADTVDDHDDHDHEEAPACIAFDVIDSATCDNFCGDGYTATYDIITEHGDTVDELHVDYFEGFECECVPVQTTAPVAQSRAGTVDEKHCKTPYILPTCEVAGLEECSVNATTTCEDLCGTLGLLAEADESHICLHVEGDDHAERRLLRSLAEGEDHGDEHHDSYTMCFCGATRAGRGVMACADEGWQDADAHAHDDHNVGNSGSARGTAVLGALIVSANLLIAL